MGAVGQFDFQCAWCTPCRITGFENVRARIIQLRVCIKEDAEEPLDTILGAFVLIEIAQASHKPIR